MVSGASSTFSAVFPHSYAVVDVETSGLARRRDRVLSVAVIQVDSGGNVEDSWSTLLDPGCDPGPVHIHGLTRERLAGSPQFADIADQVVARLEGRVFVAHNAPFDWDFLSAEAGRACQKLAVDRRLCTRALARRLDLPVVDFTLATLAEFCAVPFEIQHDALADAQALASVLPHLLGLAADQGLLLPLAACEPAPAAYPARAPKARRAYLNPGPLTGTGLVQGMRVAITGPTTVPRDQLIERATRAGLDVTNAVSRRTSALITNSPAEGTRKCRDAARHGTPIIDEAQFLALLTDVIPGRYRDHRPTESPALGTSVATSCPDPAPVAVPPAADRPDIAMRTVMPALTTSVASAPDAPAANPSGSGHAGVGAGRPGQAGVGPRPLAVRRVLVVGGPHDAAAEIRRRVIEAGGLAAVNLTASVTDVVCLPGGERDRRMARIQARGLPLTPAEEFVRRLDGARDGLLMGHSDTSIAPAGQALVRGAVVDLPLTVAGPRWALAATWGWDSGVHLDLTAFLLGEDEQVGADEDFVFYNQPQAAGGAVTLSVDGPAEQSIVFDLAALPPSAHRLVIAAALGAGRTFGEFGAVNIAAQSPDGRTWLQATLDAGTSENTMILAEIYRRGARWRLRAVGQGHDHGLPELARSYGVDIED
jgi:DNA polymerase-3 subunit epsilon